MSIRSNKLNEYNYAELPARELLERLGYVYVPAEQLDCERDNGREVLLRDRFVAALLRLNDWMREVDALRVVNRLERIDEAGMQRNQLIHEYLTYGMPFDVGDGKSRTVRFFDFEDTDAWTGPNDFIVTTQMRVIRGKERFSSDGSRGDDSLYVIPDLVLFVNGIPLVVMESKAPGLMGSWKSKAVRQLHRYQEHGSEFTGRGAPNLFSYNLMCVVHCGSDALYAPIGALESEYVGWSSDYPYVQDEARRKFNAGFEGQARLIVNLLSPATLLDVLRDFVSFEFSGGKLVKKLPRHQQYRAVTESLRRLSLGINGKVKANDRGGVIWHTQGSGKTLTMLWMAVKLRRTANLSGGLLVVVTDRRQLDRQIAETFERGGFHAADQARSTKHLRSLLCSGGSRTVFTTIQKFEEVLDGVSDELNVSDKVLVMIDEAHRTQYGVLAAKMRSALPNAAFIGFTGTPIDKQFRNTMRTFGGLIDTYARSQSVEDGVTVPIFYEARLPELRIQGPETLDKLFDTIFGDMSADDRERIINKYGDKETLAEANQRIEMIALDIADDYKKRVLPNGFKAMVVCSKRRAALEYARKLNDFGVNAYPIITINNDDGAEFDDARKLNRYAIESDFKSADGEPQILVVVDMLLTGFDAPIAQTMYLDKGLRDHTLLQAIDRVNRPYVVKHDDCMTEKVCGNVVDYYGVSSNLESALSVFDNSDIQGVMNEMYEDPTDALESAARSAESHFDGCNLREVWECVSVFVDNGANGDQGSFKVDLYERFNRDYRSFSRLMDQYLPNARAVQFVDRLAHLTSIRSIVRAQYLREDAHIDWSEISAKVKGLIDSRIGADVKSLMKPISILDRDFKNKVITSIPDTDMKPVILSYAIHDYIKDHQNSNPFFYGRLSDQLNEVIHELERQVIDAVEAVRRMAKIRDEAMSLGDYARQHGMSERVYAVYSTLRDAPSEGTGYGVVDLDEDGVEAPLIEIDEELKTEAEEITRYIESRREEVLVWDESSDYQRETRRDIKRRLWDRYGSDEDQVNNLAEALISILGTIDA